VSSLAAKLGGAGEWVHYAASKGAIQSFTVGLAREVAGEGVRVNAFRAASMYTDMAARMTQLLQQNAAAIVPDFVAAM